MVPDAVPDTGEASSSIDASACSSTADAAATETGNSTSSTAPRRWMPPAEMQEEVKLWQRETCPRCTQRAMFYCPFCCVSIGMPEDVTLPQCRLPFRQCDVVFDDAAKKATSIHAKVLAPSQVRLLDLFTSDSSHNRTPSRHGDSLNKDAEGSVPSNPEVATLREIPDYDSKSAVVLFPDEGSVLLDEAPSSWELVPRSELTLIVIDSPWRRAQVLRKHENLAKLHSVRLRAPPPSRFWRYHAEGPGCVSTIEALAAFCSELEAPVEEEHPLLFFFLRQLAHIAAQRLPEGELPTDDSAKERRSARVRQKDRAKRMRPMGPTADAADGGGGICTASAAAVSEAAVSAATTAAPVSAAAL
mmetsp:Transcript_49335/g.104949  ORF Transcript_49335/g.104949 Transcript_49335/m.104949 type:complete len:359 (-) Transcript_49335:127-1203(-)